VKGENLAPAASTWVPACIFLQWKYRACKNGEAAPSTAGNISNAHRVLTMKSMSIHSGRLGLSIQHTYGSASSKSSCSDSEVVSLCKQIGAVSL